MKISIVIPVYNSEECLLPLHAEVVKAFRDFDSYELILVNDKSPDNSWNKIVELCGMNPHVKGISLRKNFGQDNAILAGLRAAKGEFVVIMDDDLQHHPADIFKLYEKCKEGFDVCYAFFSDKQQKQWKNMGSWANGKLSEKLLNKPKEIYLSPFKIIRKEVVEELLQFKSSYSYIDATLLTLTSNITQVEVLHYERLHGKGNYSFIKSCWVFVNHMTNYSIYPLRLLTISGFSIAMISFLAAAAYLVQYFFSDKRVEGWISLVLLIIFFGGLILMSIGLIGEYIGRIFLSVNNKAQYSIEKIIQQDGSPVSASESDTINTSIPHTPFP
jgi:glycosyltransferase involved in cell wall biosynthesis